MKDGKSTAQVAQPGQGPRGNSGNPVRIGMATVKVDVTKRPKDTESVSSGVLLWGAGNKLPYHNEELCDQSPTHGALVDKFGEYVAGDKGIEIKDAPGLAKQLVGKPTRFVKQSARDLRKHGGFAWVIMFTIIGKIGRVKWINVAWCRFVLNEKGTRAVKVAVSREWHENPSEYDTYKLYDVDNPTLDPVYKLDEDGNQIIGQNGEPVVSYYENQILFFVDRVDKGNFYPKPVWVSAYESIKYDYLYNLAQAHDAETGGSANQVILVYGVDEEDDAWEEILRNFKNVLTGPKGTKTMIIAAGEEGDGTVNKVEVLTLDSSSTAKKGLEQHSLQVQQIMTAHQCPSPTIAGRPGASSLRGSGSEITSSISIWNNTTVKSGMRDITETFDDLLPRISPDLSKVKESGIEPRNMTSYITQLDPLADLESVAEPSVDVVVDEGASQDAIDESVAEAMERVKEQILCRIPEGIKMDEVRELIRMEIQQSQYESGEFE